LFLHLIHIAWTEQAANWSVTSTTVVLRYVEKQRLFYANEAYHMKLVIKALASLFLLIAPFFVGWAA